MGRKIAKLARLSLAFSPSPYMPAAAAGSPGGNVNPVMLAQVGTGDWGANLVRNFASLPECKLALLCDTDAARLGKAAKMAPGARTTTDPEDVAKDGTIEAVAIAASAVTHYQL